MRLILVIIITVFIGFLLFRPMRSEGMAIEGLTSDEAIKNVASVYNTDKMSVTNLNVTGEEVVNSLIATKASIPTLTSTNATITNLTSTNANLSGQMNAGALADSSMGNVKQYIDNAIQNSRINCNWNGWDVVCGGCSDAKDDYGLYCSNGKITHIYVVNTNGTWGYNGNNYPGPNQPHP